MKMFHDEQLHYASNFFLQEFLHCLMLSLVKESLIFHSAQKLMEALGGVGFDVSVPQQGQNTLLSKNYEGAQGKLCSTAKKFRIPTVEMDKVTLN